MLQVLNLQDFEPNFSRKTSQSLAIATLVDMDFAQCCSVLQIDANAKECRICLQNNEDDGNAFISPCKCIGTLKFVHQICYITWLQKQYSSKSSKEQKKLIDEGLQCEICKQKNYLKFQVYRKCLSCDEINQKIKKRIFTFIMLIFFIVITLVSLVLIIYFMQASNVSSFGKDLISTNVISCIFTFLLIIEIFIVYSLIVNFFMEKKIKLLSFTDRRRTKIKRTKKVIPL